MRRLLIDIECDSLNPTRIWCMVVRDIDKPDAKPDVFLSSPGLAYFGDVALIAGHNILDFDLPAIRDVWGIDLLDLYRRDNIKVHDTLVLSRLMYQDIGGGHSLRAWGSRLGCAKGGFNDWSKLSQEMIDYCIQDVEVNLKLYRLLTKKIGSWTQAIETENYLAYLCRRMHEDGFPFDARRARRIRDVLAQERDTLDAEITKAFPPKVVPVAEFTPRQTKTGDISMVGLRWYEGPLEHFSVDSPFTRIQHQPFNPSSPKQVVERLWEAGWQPTEKTDGHKDNRDKAKAEHFKFYGWKVSETNLATIPDTAPEGARLLLKRLVIETRIRKLDEWLGAYREDTGCVHGRFNHIGSWTHRMSHNDPNMANISAKKSIKYNSKELNKLATYLGGMFRRLWRAPKGKILVGVDAAGIQLRILAHYMNDEKFIHAVTKGSQKTGDDPHTLNKNALGKICESRDRAKTFIYAFLMGCTAGKVREIFNCSQKEATEAFDNFIKFYPGLYKLRTETIPKMFADGFFKGLDDRLIITPDQERLIMAGMLQGGEAVIVKRAVIKACQELDKLGVSYRLINIVHDEAIFMVDDDKELAYTVKSIVEKAIAAQGTELSLNCPMEGDGKLGFNWLETH